MSGHCRECGETSGHIPGCWNGPDLGELAEQYPVGRLNKSPTLTDEQAREKFEAFACDELQYPTELTPSGQYECHTTRKAWQAWQAAIREAIGRGERG